MQDITRGALHLAIQITHNVEEARDIIQESLVRSLERSNAPKPGQPGFKPWFYRVVHNLSIDWLRSRNKMVEHADLPEPASSAYSQELELDAQWRKHQLHQALSMLNTEQREIICLRDFHDLAYKDIAHIMDLEEGTVMSRLHRARKALKAILETMNIKQGEHDAM